MMDFKEIKFFFLQDLSYLGISMDPITQDRKLASSFYWPIIFNKSPVILT